jgi:serine/threonine protein kinase
MSEVWLAEDLRLERMVAVKLLRDSVARGEGELVANLEREARVIARLQHPNIVAVYDVGEFGTHHYLVMEYVPGASLRQMLEERGRLPVAEALAYGAQVASALEYAHRQNVVHCDVKPENILVTAGGVAKVADFGVADTVTRTLDPAAAREVLGTIAYLAPEVLQGAPADPRSDVYSLALTLYEAVAGRLPFAGTTPAAIAGQRLASAAPPLRTFAHDAPAELERVLARALAISQADRYQTAGEFRREILAVRERAGAPLLPVVAPVPVAPAAGARGGPPRRHPTTLVRRGPPPPPPEGMSGAAIGGIIALVLLAVGAAVVAAIVLLAGDDGGAAPPSPTPSPTVETPPATGAPATPTGTPSPSPTDEPSPTATPTPATPSPTASPSPSRTPPTPTAEPTATPTPQ